MRRPSHDERVAEVTRRRLAALSAELGREERDGTPDDPDHPPQPGVPSPGRHARRPVPPPRRLVDWLGDRTPAALQGRAHLGSAQVGLVCLVVAVGLVLAAFWLVRSAGVMAGEVVAPRPVGTAPAQVAVPSAGPTTGPTTGSPAGLPAGAPPTGPPPGSSSEAPATAGGQIVVDVAGKVRRPGIAVLPVGSRVVDAVRAAGGVRAGVRPDSVNLARLLTDGEQVLVGVEPATGSPAGEAVSTPGSAPSGGLVNLNTADQAALETLPGVGPVTAAAILQWRTEHGGFTAVDELLEISGIGEATLAEIAPHVTL
jgi:competence protein ComEA